MLVLLTAVFVLLRQVEVGGFRGRLSRWTSKGRRGWLSVAQEGHFKHVRPRALDNFLSPYTLWGSMPMLF